MSDAIDNEIEAFFSDTEREVDEFLDKIGAEAEEMDKNNGNYRNHTFNLRRLNYHKVEDHVLTLGNKAIYASEVSARGYDVIDSGISHLIKSVEEMA